jgi:single-stranded-DNA-specific exonuclease
VMRPEPTEADAPISAGDMINAAYTLTSNTFRGNTTVDLQIKHARKASITTS